MNLLSPLRISKKAQRLSRTKEESRSIDKFIELIINTPLGECIADPDFGFVFANMRFEMFNESEGTIHSPENLAQRDDLYSKKISGTSNNINTFANELRDAIERYESRLNDIIVSMTYNREQRVIHIKVTGVIRTTLEAYQYLTTIKVWS